MAGGEATSMVAEWDKFVGYMFEVLINKFGFHNSWRALGNRNTTHKVSSKGGVVEISRVRINSWGMMIDGLLGRIYLWQFSTSTCRIYRAFELQEVVNSFTSSIEVVSEKFNHFFLAWSDLTKWQVVSVLAKNHIHTPCFDSHALERLFKPFGESGSSK